ncbi:MAG TPA: T9SS type A sorting domain-containing protein [Chitinophagaceae bacterium]|nr:T9SS type A sorting domain-containing protein [Chitinophagaceae bacterium]
MACLSGIAVGAQAQSGSEVCSIVYSYDVSGNRIKREYKCESTRGFDDPDTIDPTIFTTLYPNPTTGVFTGEFSEPVSEATFIITAMSGVVVLEHELTQTASSITFDISAQVPGNYLLHVWALGREESYLITKNQ